MSNLTFELPHIPPYCVFSPNVCLKRILHLYDIPIGIEEILLQDACGITPFIILDLFMFLSNNTTQVIIAYSNTKEIREMNIRVIIMLSISSIWKDN